MMENPYSKKVNQNHRPPHLNHTTSSNENGRSTVTDSSKTTSDSPSNVYDCEDGRSSDSTTKKAHHHQDHLPSSTVANRASTCTSPNPTRTVSTNMTVVSAEQHNKQEPANGNKQPSCTTTRQIDPTIRGLSRQLLSGLDDDTIRPPIPTKKKLSLRQEVAQLKEQQRIRELQLRHAKEEKKKQRRLIAKELREPILEQVHRENMQDPESQRSPALLSLETIHFQRQAKLQRGSTVVFRDDQQQQEHRQGNKRKADDDNDHQYDDELSSDYHEQQHRRVSFSTSPPKIMSTPRSLSEYETNTTYGQFVVACSASETNQETHSQTNPDQETQALGESVTGTSPSTVSTEISTLAQQKQPPPAHVWPSNNETTSTMPPPPPPPFNNGSLHYQQQQYQQQQYQHHQWQQQQAHGHQQWQQQQWHGHQQLEHHYGMWPPQCHVGQQQHYYHNQQPPYASLLQYYTQPTALMQQQQQLMTIRQLCRQQELMGMIHPQPTPQSQYGPPPQTQQPTHRQNEPPTPQSQYLPPPQTQQRTHRQNEQLRAAANAAAAQQPVYSCVSPKNIIEVATTLTTAAFQDQFLNGAAVYRYTPPKPKIATSVVAPSEAASDRRPFSSPVMQDLKTGPMPDEDRQKVQQTIIQVCLNPKRSLPTDLRWTIAEECARLGYRPCSEVWPKLLPPTQPSVIAHLHDIRSNLPTMQACRCGSTTHRLVSHPKCLLFADIRSRVQPSKWSSKPQRSVETNGVVQQAVVDRWKRQKQESDEQSFIQAVEAAELRELGRAAKAPQSLSTMVLVGALLAEVAESDEEDDDEIVLANLTQLSKELCTSIVRFIAKRWGHCYREPSHVDHSWRWKTDNPREPGTRTFDALPTDTVLEFAINTGVVDELCQLIKSKVLRFDGRQLTKDWVARAERSILDDAFLAVTDASYGIPEAIHKPLFLRWQRKAAGWSLGNGLVHKDEWKESFARSYQQYRNDEAGIDKFL